DTVSRLEDVVEIEQRKTNAMVESMSEGVVMTDKDFRIVVVNPRAKQIIGKADKKNVTIFDFIDALGGKLDIKDKLEESVKLEKQLEFSEVLLNDKFYKVFIAPVKSPAQAGSGEDLLGGVVIFHDITKEKEAEKMKEDFTSMMVHELRSPLNRINMMTEMMGDSNYDEVKEEFSEYTKMVGSSATGMLEIVNDLLDVAKLEADLFYVRKDSANIESIIKERINFFKALIEDAELSVSSKVDANIPEKVPFDAVRIAQVIDNLLSNAIKFTDPGGVLSIQAFTHKKGESFEKEQGTAGIKSFFKDSKLLESAVDSVVVMITDTGMGISVTDQTQLFNKFKQFVGAAKSKKKKGTGLGLAISKGIVEAHGGVIGVNSELNQGTTFYFLIPLA
ncbi:MAG: PAS domain-containing sensor histidine kinase, partial [bacterium]|nr:PAS domain-containing sensor histidine kinase [bacterium]